MSADDMEMRNEMKAEINDGKILNEDEIRKLDGESFKEENTREEIGV